MGNSPGHKIKKVGVQKSTPPILGPFGVSCPFLSFGPLRVSCPFLSFWAPEGQLPIDRPYPATKKRGMVGNGQWLHSFPKEGDRQMPIGWDREGCAPAECIFGRGYGKAHRMYFWEGLSPKRGFALRAFPGLVATRQAAMLVYGVDIG